MLKIIGYVVLSAVLLIALGVGFVYYDLHVHNKEKCQSILAEPDLPPVSFNCRAYLDSLPEEVVYEDGSTSGPKPGELGPRHKTCAEMVEDLESEIYWQKQRKNRCRADPSSGGY